MLSHFPLFKCLSDPALSSSQQDRCSSGSDDDHAHAACSSCGCLCICRSLSALFILFRLQRGNGIFQLVCQCVCFLLCQFSL